MTQAADITRGKGTAGKGAPRQLDQAYATQMGAAKGWRCGAAEATRVAQRIFGLQLELGRI